MTAYPEISRRVRDQYHNLKHDEMVKSIFNSRKNKAGVGMKIPSWMITDEMKLTENYLMYAVVFEKIREIFEAQQDVEKVKEHLKAEEIEKMVEGMETVDEDDFVNSILDSQNDLGIRLEPESYKKILEVEITGVVPPVNVNKEEEESTKDDYEFRRREKGKNVEESRNTPSHILIRTYRIHSTLISSNTEKLQELTVIDLTPSSSTPSSSSSKLSASQRLLSLFKPKTGRFKRYKSFFKELQGRYGYLFGHLKTRFMPRKKFTVLAQYLQAVMEESLPNLVDARVKELNKTQVSIYVAEGLIMERKQNRADVAKMIADAIQQERENIRAEIYSQINNAITNHIPSQFDSLVRNYMSGHVLHVHPTQASQASAQEQQYQLYLTMKGNPQLQHDDLPIWLAFKIKFEGLTTSNNPCRSFSIRSRDQNDPYNDAHLEGKNSAKRQKTSEHGIYVFEESSAGQDNERESGPSTSGNQEQLDNFDFWTDKYAIDNDDTPTENVSQELVKEMSETVHEAKLRKVVNEMLRQRCTSGDEHQYHIDQMQNFFKNDIVWESKKEVLTSPFPPKPTPIVQSCQRDPKAHALSLVNQDLLYLKKGNLGSEKFVLSLHKFPAITFLDDDIKERTSRWRQKEVGKPKEEVNSNSKIVQVIKTYGESGHEHKFVTKVIVRRTNGSIVSITRPDYKNLNKNDIEDMYLLCINGKVGVESYQQKVNLTTPTITFPAIEKYKMFSIITELVYGIIYKNNKKEKRVMRHQEIHKLCDATLKRVLKGLKSYNNDVKHGYVTPSLSNEDDEYLCLRKKLKND
nr:hypothetical protein [Tanacetum cinerariifolium]